MAISTVTASTTTSDPLAHGRVEDIFGLLSGTFVASLGIYLLHSAHAVTGGTAGLSLLISYGTGWSFSVIYVLVNLPFLAAGVPSVDIIDLDYAPWHTAADNLDAVGARSLQVVGDVLLAALPTIEAHISRGQD